MRDSDSTITNEVIALFCDLVAIDSPSGYEGKMADKMSALLTSLGFQVDFDDSSPKTGSDTNQIIALRPGSEIGAVAFSAHLDCVEPCTGIKSIIDLESEIIRSDGDTILSADDKAGIAEIICGIKSAMSSGYPMPEITFLLSVQEERGLVGAREFPMLFDKPVLTLVFDVEGHAGEVVVKAPFRYSFTMKFEGNEAHAGFDPENGINAISMAADAVSKIKTGRLSDQATLSISSIKGGSDQRNVVAAACTVEGEFRSLDKTAGGRKREELEQILTASASKFGGRASLEWSELYPGYEFDETDPALGFLHDVADAAGIQFKAISTGGGSDANILNSKGCVAMALASGMTRCHSTSEYILIEDLVNTAKFIEQIVIAAGREDPLHHGISTETQGDLRHDHLRLT